MWFCQFENQFYSDSYLPSTALNELNPDKDKIWYASDDDVKESEIIVKYI